LANTISNPQHPLIIMIGLPGSGKSTLAGFLLQEEPRTLIATDAVRELLFGDEAIQGDWALVQREVGRQLRQALDRIQQGQIHAAIYDATNARRRYRRQVIHQVRSLGFTHLTGLWLDTPLSVCLARNQSRSRQVPEEVILQMHRQLTDAPPALEEGFDRLLHYIAFS
jgi:predicted kinase